MKKKLLSLLLSAVMLLAVVPAVSAAGSGYTDVADGVWYTDAVNYVTERNLMDPINSTTFSPNTDASRAALAVAL